MTPQPQQPRPSPQGQTPLSMNMNVSPEKRSALKNYLEGYKDAIQKKSMDQLLPNISAPQMPMQQPMQPPMMPQQPMMMNMGGVVDVFEPQYMSKGGFTSNISVKEGDTIGGRPEEREERVYSGDPAIFGLNANLGDPMIGKEDPVIKTYDADPYVGTGGDPFLAGLLNPVGSAIAKGLMLIHHHLYLCQI